MNLGVNKTVRAILDPGGWLLGKIFGKKDDHFDPAAEVISAITGGAIKADTVSDPLGIFQVRKIPRSAAPPATGGHARGKLGRAGIPGAGSITGST